MGVNVLLTSMLLGAQHVSQIQARERTYVLTINKQLYADIRVFQSLLLRNLETGLCIDELI